MAAICYTFIYMMKTFFKQNLDSCSYIPSTSAMQVYIVYLLIGFTYSLEIFFYRSIGVGGWKYPRNFCYAFTLFIECLIILSYNLNFILLEFIITRIKLYCNYIIPFYLLVFQNFLHVRFEKLCKNKISSSLSIIKDDLILITKCKLIE